MQTPNQGFTLIEILVVVLIIAVLATIAVSAYQKAVLKSRFSSLMPLAKTLTQGNEDYYLRNGQYTNDVSKLDITATGNSKAQITLGNEDQHKYVLLTRDDMKNQLRMYQQRSKNFPGETHCEALIDDNLANWLCRDALKGTLVGNKYGYTVYSLSEQTVGELARTYYDDYSGTELTDGDKCVALSSSPDYQTCRSLHVNNATCDGKTSFSCRGGEYTNKAVCNADGWQSCNGIKFTDNATCYGKGTDSCYGDNFNHSSCISVGGGWNCQGSTFTNYSKCAGGCLVNKFYDHSFCQAKTSGACSASTYDNTSFCVGSCLMGTPKGVWNEETETYERQGWHGDCCTASYVIGGACPSGVQACS